jgi:hypothetical protein
MVLRKKRTTKRSTALKAGTRRVKGRVVPKKGFKFVKNGGGRAVKAKAKR